MQHYVLDLQMTLTFNIVLKQLLSFCINVLDFCNNFKYPALMQDPHFPLVS